MSKPAVSVAMSVYNSEAFLAPAIDSILAQSFSDFEFLILNDGSTDGSAVIIDDYARRDARIRAIHRENKGLIVSLNQLIAEARAPIIARMDADDISTPDRFQKQHDFLTANPDHSVVSSWTQDIDEQGRPYRASGQDQPITHDQVLQAIEDGGTLLCHPSAMFRKASVEQVGGYHAAFRHCEDYDLWVRLASVTKLASLPERLLQYRHTEGQISNRHLVEQQTGVAASQLAYQLRKAGRPDPTQNLERLPPIEDYDALFGPGASIKARAIAASSVLYSDVALRGDGFAIVLNHIRDGNHVPGLKRTILRLLRFGEPARAMTMATALLLR